MTVDIETVVIGAGVVGLAVARQLARDGKEVLILEAADAFGTETSARNSEVIHAGIYYAKDSLKARHCVRGKHLLYDYCEQYGVTRKRCGKLIVATDESQVAVLDDINQRASANGVADLQKLSASQVAELEPQIQCHAALLSPSTGIIDSHGLMLSMLGDAETHGAVLALNSPVVSMKTVASALELEIGGADAMTLRTREVVNSAGLSACDLAATVDGIDANSVPQPLLAKGNYFQLQGKAPVSRLIYPVPVEGGLGVHITMDLAGQVRFGPDVEWVDKADYEVDPNRADSFYAAIRQYWPALEDGALLPDYAGLRPKIQKNQKIYPDFVIQGASEHRVAGLVNLYGVESPGLTACLSIAEQVADVLSN